MYAYFVYINCTLGELVKLCTHLYTAPYVSWFHRACTCKCANFGECVFLWMFCLLNACCPHTLKHVYLDSCVWTDISRHSCFDTRHLIYVSWCTWYTSIYVSWYTWYTLIYVDIRWYTCVNVRDIRRYTCLDIRDIRWYTCFDIRALIYVSWCTWYMSIYVSWYMWYTLIYVSWYTWFTLIYVFWYTCVNTRLDTYI